MGLTSGNNTNSLFFRSLAINLSFFLIPAFPYLAVTQKTSGQTTIGTFLDMSLDELFDAETTLAIRCMA
ncbi:MAG: hypothetical protein OEM01_12945 [Desulfobulbaceae bacterium]|nr:hypothetical protein [Desulfobulbaceae bacterium]